MAFSIVNTQNASRTTDGDLTLASYNSQSSGSGILLVSSTIEPSGITISDITFGGVSLTPGPGIATSSQNYTQLWWMGAPNGTEDIVASYSGTTTYSALIACVLEGADYSTGIVDTDTNTDTDGGPITSTITPTVANGIIIDALGTNQPSVLNETETGHTEIDQLSVAGGGGTHAMGYLEYAAASQQSVGWDFVSGSDWARASHVMASFGPLSEDATISTPIIQSTYLTERILMVGY